MIQAVSLTAVTFQIDSDGAIVELDPLNSVQLEIMRGVGVGKRYMAIIVLCDRYMAALSGHQKTVQTAAAFGFAQQVVIDDQIVILAADKFGQLNGRGRGFNCQFKELKWFEIKGDAAGIRIGNIGE